MNDVYIYDARGNGGGQICPNLTGDHQNRVTDYTAIVITPPRDSRNTGKTNWGE